MARGNLCSIKNYTHFGFKCVLSLERRTVVFDNTHRNIRFRLATAIRLVRKAAATYRLQGTRALAAAVLGKLRTSVRDMLFRPYMIRKSFANQTYLLCIPDMFARGWYDRTDAWPELQWIGEHLLKQGYVVVDCGANIGFTSAYFSRCVGESGYVIAVEALPDNARVARKNVELNGCANVEVVNIAVSDSEGETDFLLAPNGSIGRRDDMESLRVPMTTLDTLLGGRKANFIKIDVEGHELEVLKGATRTLSSAPALDIEVHCASFRSPTRTLGELFALLPVSEYWFFLQKEVDGEIIQCELNSLDISGLAHQEVIHLFCKPRHR